MEFIKVFEEAKKLGITKEEFLPIWELESRRKQRDGGSGTTLQSMDLGNNQIESNDCQLSKTKLSQQLQQIKEELHQDLKMKLQYMFNELIEKQEMQFKQLWHKNDETWNELRNHFGILSSHISNTSEAHTSSLKLFLMQEISLLEQDLKKMIEMKSKEQEDLLMSQKQAALQDCRDRSEETNNFCITSDKGAEPMYCPQLDIDDTKFRGHQQKQRQQQQQLRLPESESVMCVNEQKKTLSNKSLQFVDPGSINRKHGKAVGETQQTEHSQSNPEFCNLPAYLNSDHAITDKNTPKGVFPVNASSSTVSADVTSTKATGSYAEAISKQIKAVSLTSLTKDNSVLPRKGHDSSFYNKEEAKGFTSSPSNDSKAGSEMNEGQNLMKYIPTEYGRFMINECDNFASSHQEYMTPFYYTKSGACRIKLCIWFNANYQLNVSLIISNGRYDNSVKWPIRFTGSGFIYNESSKASSQIWALGPLMCSKPESGKNITFKAAVSLRTLRNNTPDVTYYVITDKGYTSSQRLCFSWNLSAFEKSGI